MTLNLHQVVKLEKKKAPVESGEDWFSKWSLTWLLPQESKRFWKVKKPANTAHQCLQMKSSKAREKRNQKFLIVLPWFHCSKTFWTTGSRFWLPSQNTNIALESCLVFNIFRPWCWQNANVGLLVLVTKTTSKHACVPTPFASK